MSLLISSRFIFLIFVLMGVTFPFAREYQISRHGEDTILDMATEYLQLFKHCTIMVFSKEKVSPMSFTKPILGPVVLLEYSNRNLGKLLAKKFSLQRRRNPVKHCWATFAVLPEKSELILHYMPFVMKKTCFIEARLSVQYFIWVTSTTLDVLTFESNILELGLREVIILKFSVFFYESPLLRMYYYNMYHLKNPPVGVELSEQWYEISCLPFECLYQLDTVSNNVSKLNKYFWYNPRTLYVLDHVDFTHLGYQKLASVTTKNTFLAYLIFQDVLINGLKKSKTLHYISPIKRIRYYTSRWFNFLYYDVKSYSFVSCYGIRSSFDLGSALTGPFDVSSWTILATSFIIVVIIFTSLRRNVISDGFFLVVGISLESSVLTLQTVYETTFRRKKHYLVGSYAIIAVWIVLMGTILTNWYKTWFTMEMIIPTKYKSPWDSVINNEGITVLMTFSLLDDNYYEVQPKIDFFRYRSFYFEILLRCLEIASQDVEYKRLVHNRKTAKALADMLLYHLGYNANLIPIMKGRALSNTRNSANAPQLNKSALQNIPIRPVEYDEGDSYKITKTLKTCQKVALMDEKQNIAKITAFLNDNEENVVFVSGDGDSFFTTIVGWEVAPAKDSYVEIRLKVFISSGIWTHWENLYDLWRPEKLLFHYVNWTNPRVEMVSKLNFSSKIVTAFYVCGLCLIVCFVVLLGELLRYRFESGCANGIYKLVVSNIRDS
ncbi:Leucine-rich repeat-containing protein 30 [Folsomia candida]|uniref:Leucine-rich repeat-containing protein 30 n=1 Tax=Folsomia candida TaxID=158441 RepID=A0A226DC03_FOLCA|nr:Leucine-rich repeat-containing protein 30 [Folsomia candida]